MARHEQQHRRSRDIVDDALPPPPPTAGASQAAAQARQQELDDLLGEIDTVLETNAETFVKGFVQKGGQ